MIFKDAIDALKKTLASIEEGIEMTELYDLAYTRHYTKLCRQRRVLKRVIKIMERTELLG